MYTYIYMYIYIHIYRTFDSTSPQPALLCVRYRDIVCAQEGGYCVHV